MGPQLVLPGIELDSQAVVPFDPEPYQTRRGMWNHGSPFIGDWNWEYRPGVTACTNIPERSENWLAKSPWQPGMEFEDGVVVDSVQIMLISVGWVWVLKLRGYNDDDLTPFWNSVKPPPAKPPPEDEDKEDWLDGFGPGQPVHSLPVE